MQTSFQLQCVALAAALLAGCDHSSHRGGTDAASDASYDAPDAVDGDDHADFEAPTTWSVAVDESPLGALMSAWGAPGATAWAVGGQLTLSSSPGSRAVLRREGGAWSAVAVPEGGMLNWVHGSGSVMWMVGEGGKALLWRDGAFIEEVQTPTTAALWGVWCASDNACWSVGGDPRRAESTPVMLTWDGSDWRTVELPPTERASRALFKVWGSSASDIHAVGALGLTYHFDGQQWRLTESGVRDDLISLWGRGSDDIVAVGGRINGVVGRWRGDAWEFADIERSPGLNGVWMAPTGDAWLAGANGRLALLSAGTFDVAQLESPTLRVLHAIFGSSDGVMIAVGGSLDGSLPWTGVVVEGQ